jgi:hypothetical protein
VLGVSQYAMQADCNAVWSHCVQSMPLQLVWHGPATVVVHISCKSHVHIIIVMMTRDPIL